MITNKYWSVVVVSLLTALAHSQEAKPSAAALSVRAFMHDPSRAAAELYLRDVKESDSCSHNQQSNRGFSC